MAETGNLTHDTRNSKPDPAEERIKSFVERVARLMTERKERSKEFTDDIREVISEAKAHGFDTKIIRKAAAEKVRIESMDSDDHAEEAELIRIYFRAAGVPVPGQVVAGDDE